MMIHTQGGRLPAQAIPLCLKKTASCHERNESNTNIQKGQQTRQKKESKGGQIDKVDRRHFARRLKKSYCLLKGATGEEEGREEKEKVQQYSIPPCHLKRTERDDRRCKPNSLTEARTQAGKGESEIQIHGSAR
mmetsp:Transcript_33833/g.67022  ORF Transcript_33833/g.67022 Transcript_33833/m.67022 type:complete len:134 (-) Transcript_33833:2236-2637(-)